MASPVVIPPDPVLDNSYGQQPTEPRSKQAPPISRSLQFTDDFAPELPAALQTPAPDAPVPPVAPPPVQVTPEAPPVPPVAVTPPAPLLAPDGQPPVKVVRVIDLKDGSGVQTFEGEGPTLEAAQNALLDKMTQAQEHGTRKIRELREKAKAKPDRDIGVKPLHFQPRAITDAELIQLKELQASNPVEAQRMLLEITLGIKPEVLVNAVNDMQIRAIRDMAELAATEFIADHEDFENTPAQGKAIQTFLRGCTRDVKEGGYACKFCGKTHDPEFLVTRNNLEYAFEQLVDSGAIKLKEATPAPVVTPTPTPVIPPVPVAVTPPVTPTSVTPVSTPIPPPPVVLSDRSGQRPPVAQDSLEGVDVAKLVTGSLSDMRSGIQRLMKQSSNTGR